MPIEIDITIDASTAAKLFLEEDDSGAVRAWYYWLQDHGARFRAPHLLQYELAQVLAGKIQGLAPEDRGQVLTDALTGIRLSELPSIETPFEHTPPLSYYDAAYLTHALESGHALATHDEALAHAHHRPELVWTAARIRRATDPGFSAWLTTQRRFAALRPKAGLRPGDPPRSYLDVAWAPATNWDDATLRRLCEAYDAFCATPTAAAS